MKDLTKLKFGHLCVVSYSHIHKQPSGAKVHYWNVVCDCGKHLKRKATHLTFNKYKYQSCGCIRAKATGDRFRTHGLKSNPIYEIWQGMIKRCHTSNHPNGKTYKQKGITVCKEWFAIEAFYRDMGDRPEGMTLERIDNNKGYNKENCRWATWHDQARNSSRNNNITINGTIKCLVDWCSENNIHPATACNRIATGWPPEVAVTKPTLKSWNKNQVNYL